MKKTVLIYDQDADHARRLGDFIGEYSSPGIDTIEFSNIDTLKEYLEERMKSGEVKDVFLVCGEEVGDRFEFENKILLTEDRDKEDDKKDKSNRVYRYQAGKELSRDIVSCIEREAGTDEQKKVSAMDKEPIYTVIGIDAFDPLKPALQLDDILDRKYLLVDIRSVKVRRDNGKNKEDISNYTAGLSCLLFALNSKSLDVEEMMRKKIIRREDHSVIEEVNSFTDIACLTGEGVERIAEAAKNIGYEGIILISDCIGALALGKDILKGRVTVVERNHHAKNGLSAELLKTAGLNSAQIKKCRVINADRNEKIAVPFETEIETLRAYQ